ncbi:MAG: GH25 family lysozyme [bacterium]|nr:GH25 family lysozyme [bacterium]
MKVSKKKIMIILIIALILVFILIAALTVYKKITNDLSKKNILIIKEEPIEVYADAKISDFVNIKNGKIITDKKIDTTELGKKEISFQYKDNYGKHHSRITVEIEDTTKPVVWVSGSYTYTIGSNQKIEDAILCGDNYDKTPICKIEGFYDLNKKGSYSLQYTAIDHSGNKEQIPFTLKVIEKSKSSSDTTNGTSLNQIKKDYITEDVSLGIDVSKWQADINWEEVKNQGIEFAMIRLGTQSGIGKDSVLDQYFKKNIKEAKKVGMKVGVYYFSYASSIEEAKNQAKWVIERLSDYQLDLPVVFDWECYNYFNSFQISLHDLNEIVNTFLKIIEENGYQPMFYGSKNYLEKIWTNINYDIWLAHYTKQTNYQGDYKMWQFTSSGRISGISSLVDIDIMKK